MRIILATLLLAATPAAHAKVKVPEKPRAWIGVALGQKSPGDLAALKSTTFADGCARVNAVMAGTPALDAGLQGGDFICSVSGKRTLDAEQLIGTIKTFEVGSNVTLQVVRESKVVEFKMTLAPKPGDGEDYMRSVLMGKRAPEVKIDKWIGPAPASGGKFDDKVTIIDFWEPWCRPCLSTIPQLNELHKKYSDKGLQILGLATEPEDELKKVQSDLKMTYPIGLDKDGIIKSKFLVMAIPTMLLIDRKGHLVDVHVGAGDMSEFIAAMKKALSEK